MVKTFAFYPFNFTKSYTKHQQSRFIFLLCYAIFKDLEYTIIPTSSSDTRGNGAKGRNMVGFNWINHYVNLFYCTYMDANKLVSQNLGFYYTFFGGFKYNIDFPKSLTVKKFK